MTEARRPRILTALLVIVVLTGLSAIPAGIGLLTDPTGSSLGMSPDLLHRGPFDDFTIPGLFLLLVLGVGAALPAWGLGARKPWGATAALGYAIVLLAWISAQAAIIGIVSPLQPVYGSLGLIIAAFALAVRNRPDS